MTNDIQFPPLCALCAPDYAPIDCPPGTYYSPCVGRVCLDCNRLLNNAHQALKSTRGIAAYPIQDGERNDINPPSFLRRQEDQS